MFEAGPRAAMARPGTYRPQRSSGNPCIGGATVSVGESAGRPRPFAVSKAEAADLLGVSSRLVETLIARREFPVLRLGDRVVVPLRALEEWATTQALASLANDEDEWAAAESGIQRRSRTTGRRLSVTSP